MASKPSREGRERGQKAAKEKPALPLPAIDVADFAAESFRVEDFVARLAAPALERAAAAAKATGTRGSGAAALADVKLLLGHFERCAGPCCALSGGCSCCRLARYIVLSHLAHCSLGPGPKSMLSWCAGARRSWRGCRRRWTSRRSGSSRSWRGGRRRTRGVLGGG